MWSNQELKLIYYFTDCSEPIDFLIFFKKNYFFSFKTFLLIRFNLSNINKILIKHMEEVL